MRMLTYREAARGLWNNPEFEERLRRDEPLLIRRFVKGFKKAITDTIEALNTGVRRLRDGTEVGRIPRKAQLKDPAKRLRPCGCGDPRCSVFPIEPSAAQVMDDLRDRSLGCTQTVYRPRFVPDRSLPRTVPRHRG